jgi:hypothetical protein
MLIDMALLLLQQQWLQGCPEATGPFLLDSDTVLRVLIDATRQISKQGDSD